MKRDEIIREYKWMKVLRAILRMVDKLPGAIMSLIIILLLSPIYIVVFMVVVAIMTVIIPALIIMISIRCDLDVEIAKCVGIILYCIVIFIVYMKYGIDDDFMHLFLKIWNVIWSKCFWWVDLLWERIGFLRHYKTNLSGRLLRHYEKKWGMNEEQIKDYIAKREVLGEWSITFILPLLHRLSKLNESDRDKQEIFLSDRFSEDEILQIFEMEESESRFDEAISYWRKEDLSERKKLMELLFKFTIVEDGIRNNEWYLLLDIMKRLKFNKNYFGYFKRRYSSLRMEFDEYKRSSLSLKDYGVSLQPYYSVLGLEEGATDEEIKRAYHELAMQHHPDLPKNANRIEECEAKMMEINEAYEKVRG
ncbi:MAG: DnaJ domain-containing protein [Paludibacteraceae bacterium]|nr:DnaJ domain-containing protein [Paludibacteraceae bacterium]